MSYARSTKTALYKWRRPRREIDRDDIDFRVLGERSIDVEMHGGVSTKILVEQDQPTDVGP